MAVSLLSFLSLVSSFLAPLLLLFEVELLLLLDLLFTTLSVLFSDLEEFEDDELFPSLESLFSLYFSSSLLSFDLDFESFLSLVFDEDTPVVSLSFFLL